MNKVLKKLDVKSVAALSGVKPPATINRIIRELVENSIDAGATKIKVDITSGGFDKISVIDNGIGIKKENATKICSFSCTDKINSISDLPPTETFGFSGTSLASISCICGGIAIQSRHISEEKGFDAVYSFSTNVKLTELDTDISPGTKVSVRKLFSNIPDNQTVSIRSGDVIGLICRMMNDYSIGYPEISFVLSNNEVIVAVFEKKQNSDEIMKSIYPNASNTKNSLIPAYFEMDNGRTATMILGNPSEQFNSSEIIKFMINGRHVSIPALKRSIQSFYNNLACDYLPFCVIMMSFPKEDINLNILSKDKIKFPTSDTLFTSILIKLEQIYSLRRTGDKTLWYNPKTYERMYDMIRSMGIKHICVPDEQKAPQPVIQTVHVTNKAKGPMVLPQSVHRPIQNPAPVQIQPQLTRLPQPMVYQYPPNPLMQIMNPQQMQPIKQQAHVQRIHQPKPVQSSVKINHIKRSSGKK